ncbi:MAG TPA: NAD(P)-binding domain-containing protein [Candidatus Bathyarchaeia archaeon]
MKICVLGLGEVGLPTAMYCKRKGLQVFGYDIKQEAVERARKHGMKASTDWQEIPGSDVYIVCVYAGLKNGNPDFSSIIDVCKKINEKKLKTCLVSIESTLMPGLCRKLYEDVFQKRVRLVHVPHRFFAGDPVKHGVKQVRVIGAINDESLEEGWKFYNKILDVPLHKVSSIEIAEMVKIAENTYRYVQIAFAEELKITCDKSGIDFNQVREACNTKWNIEIPEARDGIGGHCLPKDTRYFASLTNNTRLVNAAMLVDETYRKWINEKVDKKPNV